jgi:hypothetical protein
VFFTTNKLLKKARQNQKLFPKSFDIVASTISKMKSFVSGHDSLNRFYLTKTLARQHLFHNPTFEIYNQVNVEIHKIDNPHYFRIGGHLCVAFVSLLGTLGTLEEFVENNF